MPLSAGLTGDRGPRTGYTVMTALQAPGRPIVAVLPGPGWCMPCAAAGERRPAADPRTGAACRDHLRLLPARPPLPAQPALFDVERVSWLLQAEYPTGVRVSCSPCAVAGRDVLGLPYRFAEDPTPLCLECWRRRGRETGRRGTAAGEPVEWVDEIPAGCAACGSPDTSPGCWLCGYSWLAGARAAHELQVEADQAAVDAEFARVAAREQAAERVEWLTNWVSRVRGVLAAYTDPNRRGAPGTGWGRAVELLADALARDVAERSSTRGRPSGFRLVAAVMAVDADYRSGRRAMPGRAECAELAGVCERAVSSAWKRGVQIGAWIRTAEGRRLSLAERTELQRGNDRAVYDLRPVNRSTDPAARDAMVPAALQALDELLDRGLQLLIEAQQVLDQHDSPTRGPGRAPNVDVMVVRAQRARLRQIVERTRATASVFAEHLKTGDSCAPHLVSKGECVSSCLRGLASTFVNRRQLHSGQRPHRGRGKTDIGASRSPTKSAQADLGGCGSVVDQADRSQRVFRPRTEYTL